MSSSHREHRSRSSVLEIKDLEDWTELTRDLDDEIDKDLADVVRRMKEKSARFQDWTIYYKKESKGGYRVIFTKKVVKVFAEGVSSKSIKDACLKCQEPLKELKLPVSSHAPDISWDVDSFLLPLIE